MITSYHSSSHTVHSIESLSNYGWPPKLFSISLNVYTPISYHMSPELSQCISSTELIHQALNHHTIPKHSIQQPMEYYTDPLYYCIHTQFNLYSIQQYQHQIQCHLSAILLCSLVISLNLSALTYSSFINNLTNIVIYVITKFSNNQYGMDCTTDLNLQVL